MIIKSFTFNPFSTNCYVVTSNNETVIIDPSCQSELEHEELTEYVDSTGSTITRILLTHAHIDHIFGCARLSEQYGIGIEVHREENVLLEQATFQAQMYGVELVQPPKPVAQLEEGQIIEFGSVRWQVLHTPGHSPGSVSFFDAKNSLVFSGDVLFQDSIGRTDLWRGSLPILMDSIFNTLIPLGDDVRVLSGHGPNTTIKRERKANPFLVDFSPLS
ncbi:MBL fold metallo-hydrolase [bacterium]|nr:MBL fold metallo-hydrolase [bacterium]